MSDDAIRQAMDRYSELADRKPLTLEEQMAFGAGWGYGREHGQRKTSKTTKTIAGAHIRRIEKQQQMAREIEAVAESLADVVQELYEGSGTVNPVYADALHDIHDRLLSIARGEST